MKKVLVRVHGDNPQNIKVKPQITSDGQTLLVMQKATKDRFGWTVNATGKIGHDLKGQAFVDVVRGKTTPLEVNVDNNNVTEKINLDEVQHLIKFKIFEAAYGKIEEKLAALKPWIITILIVAIIAIAVSAYNAYAISQLPHTLPTATQPPVVIP